MHASTAIHSPVGRLTLLASARGLTSVMWEHEQPAPSRSSPPGNGDGGETAGRILAEAARQLGAYFAGRLRTFDLPLDPAGTPFQKLVWTELNRIPYGETRSYGQVARALGQPGAARAVGIANNRNPNAIVTPCHRVIGSDGKLVGFGGGLPAKAYLLALESGSLFPLTPPRTPVS